MAIHSFRFAHNLNIEIRLTALTNIIPFFFGVLLIFFFFHLKVVYSEGNGENGSLSVETIRSAVVTVRPDLVPLLSETALC